MYRENLGKKSIGGDVRRFAQPRKLRTLTGRDKAEPAGVHMPCLKAVLRGGSIGVTACIACWLLAARRRPPLGCPFTHVAVADRRSSRIDKQERLLDASNAIPCLSGFSVQTFFLFLAGNSLNWP